MINITWPTDTEVEVIDAIREAIGRDVTFFYIYSSYPCGACSYDPVTDASKDAFCSTCSGEYWIPLYSGADVNAHISWGYSEQLGWVQGGQLAEGECRIQIKNIAENSNYVNIAKWVIVDSRRMQIIKRTPRGAKEINRILVDLIQEERED